MSKQRGFSGLIREHNRYLPAPKSTEASRAEIDKYRLDLEYDRERFDAPRF